MNYVLEKVIERLKGSRGIINGLTKSLRFTTPATIIGEPEGIWFLRRSYRSVFGRTSQKEKIVLELKLRL